MYSNGGSFSAFGGESASIGTTRLEMFIYRLMRGNQDRGGI